VDEVVLGDAAKLAELLASIGLDDLVETGSIAEARAKGKARVEGKDYVMNDGDVVEFRFND
jgi:ribosome-binding ATPase YchF (GTP1/OBG family)